MKYYRRSLGTRLVYSLSMELLLSPSIGPKYGQDGGSSCVAGALLLASCKCHRSDSSS